MATASAVPETYELEGTDARTTLRNTGWWRLLKDSFTRFRTSDGFTSTRAIAHAAVLTAFPALITILGLASALDIAGFHSVLEGTLLRIAPGSSGRLLSETFRQGSASAGSAALIGGLLGVLFSGTSAMTLVERACNRVYGMTRDRKLWRKILIGLALNVSAGILLAVAFVLLAAGGALGEGLTSAGWSDTAATVFAIARWPVGLLMVFAALTLIYKVAPNRKQPSAAWLLTGTIMATILWVALTALLALYYSVNDQLGDTYGPLVGVIALLTWAYASALAILLGIAFAAQLEAVRAGLPGPRTLRRFNEVVRDPEDTSALEERRPEVPREPAPAVSGGAGYPSEGADLTNR